MLQMKKIALIPLNDLRHLSVTCQHCGTEVVLDVSKRPSPETHVDSYTPNRCPGCTAHYDSTIKSNVDRFRDIYAAVASVRGLSFRIEEEDKQA
jgi:hypothetical protein